MTPQLRCGPSILIVGLILGLAAPSSLVAADRAATYAEDSSATVSPLRDSLQAITSDELFSKLLEHNRLRDARLQRYAAVRTYALKDVEGKIRANATVAVHYTAPETKEFKTTSEGGSWVIRSLVFKRLLESETEAATGQQRRDSSIKPANYTFRLIGEQDVGPYHCIVAEAVPKRRDKYLFEGRIWIDSQDFAVVKISGHPAKKLSFWINRADFVRQYQKIGEFWLPRRDETFVEVKLYGKKRLTIDYEDYTINQSVGNDQAQGIVHDEVITR